MANDTNETKVVQFPRRRRVGQVLHADDKLVSDIRRAYRKLWRAIDAARRAGLHVDYPDNGPPACSRKF